MSAQDCIKIIRDASGGVLSDDEITELVEQLQSVRDARVAEGKLDNLEEEMARAAEGIADDVAQAAQIEKRNRLINIRRRADILAFAAQMDAQRGDPALALTAIDVGINQKVQGARRSVDARSQALFTQHMGGMIAELRRADLLIAFNNRDLQRSIARELYELRPDGQPGASGSKEARGVAEIIDKYRSAAVARENRAGAWIKPLPGYVTRQAHDMFKLRRAGYEAWRDAILPRLDAERTFAGADPEKFLRGAYDGLVTGVHMKANGAEDKTDLLFQFKGPGNLAKRASQHRVLHFKDSDAWYEYNEQFGQRGLIESIVAEADSAARNTALMEAYGTNPAAMRESIVDALKVKHRGDTTKIDRLNARSLANQFSEVTGETRIPTAPMAAHVGQSIRNVTNMAKLGGATLSALADIAFKALEIQRQGGRNLLESYGATLSSTVDGLAGGERRAAADLIGVGLDGMIGDVSSRFNATDGLPGKFAAAQQIFFKLNLLAPWTDANQRGIGLMMARDLAMAGQRSWADLPQARMLELYGFDETRWNLARTAVRTEADGRAYLMPDGIRDIPDEAIQAAMGKKVSAREAQRIRDGLETDLRAYYVDRVDTAIPTPGARERAFLRQGTRPGSALGEAIRYVAQFNAFPTTALMRQAGAIAEADSMGQFFRNLAAGRGDALGLVHMIISTTILGYLAQSAKEMARGRSPRDPAMVETWTAAMLQGGGLGIFGDFLFGQTNRFGGSLLATLAGPVPSEIENLVKLKDAMMAGDDVAAQAFRTIQNNTPYANLFYTRAAMEYLFIFQISEAINPGYLRRMERRIKQEQGQTFMVPPSRAIPTGGGGRLFEGVRQ